MAKEVVYKVKLEASQFKEGLKGVSDGIKQLQKLLEKPLAVKIDEGQVRKLEKFLTGRFDNLGQQLRSTMNGAAKDTITALNGIKDAIVKMAPQAQAASTQVGNAISSGVGAGVKKAMQSLSRDLSQLENRALNSATDLVSRYGALGDKARAAFQKALPKTRVFSSDPEALATELIGSFPDNKGGRKPAFDVKAEGDFKRALKVAEANQRQLEAEQLRATQFSLNQDKIRAEADRKESQRQKKELAGRVQTHEEYADDLQKRAEGSARRRLAQMNAEAKERDNAAKREQSDVKARLAQADREFSDKQKTIGEQLRLMRELRKGANQEEAREIEQRIAGLKRAQEVERRLVSDKVQAQREFERLQKKALAGGVSTAQAGVELTNPEQLMSAGFLNVDKIARYTAAIDLAIQRTRELQRIQNTPQGDLSGVAAINNLLANSSVRAQLAHDDLAFRARSAGINPASIGLHGPDSLTSAGFFNPQKHQQIEQSLTNQRRIMNAQAEAAKRLSQSTSATENSITRTLLFMVRWLVFIRAVHEITAAIERSVGAIVRSGIEYVQTQELQQLALAATLNEHAKVVDFTGRQLHGMTSLNALQGSVNKQWKDLQKMSVSVVGSTQDLMDIYVGLIPPVGRLKGNLNDVQQLTRSTAIAAGTLAIPFQDARTAVVSLLRGNFLGRNRLVGALGITAAEVKNLKDTPALLDRVKSSLASFDLLATRAQTSFGALKETFVELTGRLGGELVTPFTNLFKEGVINLQKALFDSEFQPTDKTALFFSIIKSSLNDIASRLREFVQNVAGGGSASLLTFMIGVRRLVDSLAVLATKLYQVTIATGEFIAQNQTLIKVFALLAGSKAVFDILASGSAKVMKAAAAIGEWMAAQNAMRMVAAASVPAVEEVGTAAVVTAGKVSLLAKGIGLLAAIVEKVGPALITGAIVTALVKWIKLFTDAKDSADAFYEALQRNLRGDVTGALAAADRNARDSNPDVAAAAQRTAGTGSDMTSARLTDLITLELGQNNPVDAYKFVTKELIDLDEKFKDAVKANSRERQLAIIAEMDIRNKQKDELRSNLETQATLGAKADDLRGAAAKLRDADNPMTLRNLGLSMLNPFRGEQVAKSMKAMGINDIRQLMARRKEVIEALLGDAKKLEERSKQAKTALKNLDLIDASITGLLFGDDPEAKEKQPVFRNTIEPVLEAAQRDLANKQAIVNELRAQDLVSERQHELESRKITDEELQTQLDAFDQMEVMWKDHIKELTAFHAQKGDLDKNAADIKEQDQKFMADLKGRRDKALSDAAREKDVRGIRDEGFGIRMNQMLKEVTNETDQFIDQMIGKTEDKVMAQVQARIDDLTRKFRDAPELVKPLIDKLKALQVPMARLKSLGKDVQGIDSNLQSLQTLQQGLNEKLEVGAISTSDYTAQTRALEAEEAKLLTRKQELLQELINLGTQLGVDQSTIDSWTQAQLQARIQLEQLTSQAVKARNAFNALRASLDSLASIGQLFSQLEGGLGALSKIFETASKAGGAIQNIKEFFGTIKNLTDALHKMGGGFGKGGMNFFSQFSGGLGMKKGADGTMQATAASSIFGGAMVGVGAGLAIAGALFEARVKKIKETLSKNLEDISKALNNGSINLAEAEQRVEQARKDAVAKYSRSKAGRAALKDLLPQFDQQLDDLKNRAKDIRKAFDEKLRDTKLGSGPFADFAKMLIDLEKTTKDYLDTFRKGTKEYAAALRKVSELWDATLRQAKLQLQSQLMDFNSQAINDAMQVFDLMDQRSDMFDQLADIEERFADLREQQQQDAIDKEKEWNEIQKKRTDTAKKMLDIQKQIADIIRKAAEDEAAIRRRGVLEAQETIAVTKAREISQVRNEAQERIDDLREQLAELNEEQADTSAIDEFNKKWEKRAKAVEKETKELDKQRAKTREQLRLNEIRLRVAREIAQIEGTVFDLTGDRLALEERAGNLAIEQARIRVKQWDETKKLIESIIDMGDGVLFNPPPGFPQINVKIGDINVNTTNNNGSKDGDGSGSGGGNGNGPGGEDGPPRDNRDDRRDRRRGKVPALASDVERQFGEHIGGIR